MTKLTVRNLESIRSGRYTGVQLAEALDDLLKYHGNVADQTCANPLGEVSPPPAPAAMNIVAAGGIFDCQIQDSAPVARGVVYHIESSASPAFINPRLEYSGPSRNVSLHLGNQTLYFRTFSQYPTSAPSAAIYFGGVQAPIPVLGGGAVTGPVRQASAGSGTAATAGNSSRPEGFGFLPKRGTPNLGSQ